MTKEIELSKQGWKFRGMFKAIVDDEDFNLINSFAWSYCVLSDRPYAITTLPKNHAGRRQMLMHQMIMGISDGMDIDHIDGNGLNNSRSNLRVCTRAQNLRNSSARKQRKYKGVQRVVGGKYIAKICFNGLHIHLGTFETEIEAAMAYNQAAKEYHGDFARLNDI